MTTINLTRSALGSLAAGELRLTKGRTTVALRNSRIRVTGSQATISARVGTTRATIINLDLTNAKATRPALNLRLRNVGVRLNATGTSALNKAFKTSAFKSGLKLGTTLATGLGLPSADGATLGTAVVTATIR